MSFDYEGCRVGSGQENFATQKNRDKLYDYLADNMMSANVWFDRTQLGKCDDCTHLNTCVSSRIRLTLP